MLTSSSAAERGPGEEEPAGEEGEAAKGRDRAEPAGAGETQQVKAAGEKDRAGKEEPAGEIERDAGPASSGPGDGEQRQGVVHLVAHGRLEDLDHVRRKTVAQRVGTEGAGADRQECRERPEDGEGPLH